MTQISLIACVDERLGLAYQNKLLFKNKDDINWFKQHTHNKACILGRNTYESIGSPLKNRINVVLTRDESYNPHPDVLIRHSVEEILHELSNEKEILICGGEQIYRLFYPYANKLYITRVRHKYDKVDSFFPKFYESEWKEYFFKQNKDGLIDFTFHTYKRIEK